MTVKKWQYSGDIDLTYGGIFINLDDWKSGYVEYIRVMDEDVEGEVYITSGIVYGMDDKKKVVEAVRCWYWTPQVLLSCKGHIAKKHAIAEALLHYGHHEVHSQKTFEYGDQGSLAIEEYLLKHFGVHRLFQNNVKEEV